MFSCFLAACLCLKVNRGENEIITSHDDYSGDVSLVDKTYQDISVVNMYGSAFDMTKGSMTVTNCQFSGCSGTYGT